MHEKVGGQTTLIDPALEKVGGSIDPPEPVLPRSVRQCSFQKIKLAAFWVCDHVFDRLLSQNVQIEAEYRGSAYIWQLIKKLSYCRETARQIRIFSGLAN